MIAYRIHIEELPKTCMDCECYWCSLPLRHTKSNVTNKLLKKYLTQRHEKCSLIEIKEEI